MRLESPSSMTCTCPSPSEANLKKLKRGIFMKSCRNRWPTLLIRSWKMASWSPVFFCVHLYVNLKERHCNNGDV
jgi:hypothetical protein